MNPPENDDALDRLLREQDPYLEDNGFTARVLAALPRRRHENLRTIILLAATAIGAVLAVSLFTSVDMPPPDLHAMLSLDWQVLLPWAAEMLTVFFLVGGALAAVQPEGGSQWIGS
jgi:hypothetical protein